MCALVTGVQTCALPICVLRQLDQFGGLDAERAGDAVHPAEREGAGAGFEAADRLRGGRRVAALRDLFQCQALGAAHGADTVDHAIVPITRSVSSFLQNNTMSSVARKRRIA